MYGSSGQVTEEYDVVVVGAGPAGISAASEAARAGARVCVLERGREIGSPIRTSGGSFIAELQALGIPDRFFHPVRRVRFVSPHRQISFEYAVPVACVLDVRRLYQHLATEAAARGATIRLNCEVVDVVKEGERVGGVIARVGGESCRYLARVVVDASGFAAVVLRKAGMRGPFRRFGFGVEYDLYAPDCREDEVVLAVGRDVAPSGYGWVFPWGGQRVRAGVGVIHPDTNGQPADYLDRFVRACSGVAQSLVNAQPLELHVGYIPSEGLSSEFVFEGVVAVGDAAGQASTLLGEGIRYAIKAGRLAGRVVAECVLDGNCSLRRLKRYEESWKREQGLFMRIAYEVNRRIAGYNDRQWDDRVEILGRLSPELFAQGLMGEFTPAWAARVLAKAPASVGVVLKQFAGRLQGSAPRARFSATRSS